MTYPIITVSDAQNLQGGDDITLGDLMESDMYAIIEHNEELGDVVWGYASTPHDAREDAKHWMLESRPDYQICIESTETYKVVLGKFQKKIEVVVYSDEEISDDVRLLIDLDSEDVFVYQDCMKAYGANRRDALTCRHGCCHGIYCKGRWYRPKKNIRRSLKHRARRESLNVEFFGN